MIEILIAIHSFILSIADICSLVLVFMYLHSMFAYSRLKKKFDELEKKS